MLFSIKDTFINIERVFNGEYHDYITIDKIMLAKHILLLE